MLFGQVASGLWFFRFLLVSSVPQFFSSSPESFRGSIPQFNSEFYGANQKGFQNLLFLPPTQLKGPQIYFVRIKR
ncbi:MAG: hypothetical protein CMN32_01995 [Saprospirales bacterium]|nr:hypothetical protein [Saprospirales bacterium]